MAKAKAGRITLKTLVITTEFGRGGFVIYKQGVNGKVYNSETEKRVYRIPMLAQRFFGGSAGRQKFQDYPACEKPA